ncbi:MAG: matrixin family metalloprotease, partial [Rubricoccaceae bacterium]|nr:matrixin family metalloprotease [Rubricoccaceae bacterium]
MFTRKRYFCWLVVTVVVLMAKGESSAFVYNGVAWCWNNIVFEISPTEPATTCDGGSPQTFIDIMEQAAAVWNVECFTIAPIAFDAPEGACKNVQCEFDPNGQNEVSMSQCPLPQYSLARAHWWWIDSGDSAWCITEADICFNDFESWFVDSGEVGCDSSSCYDLYSVAAHEFGHWISLGHEDHAVGGEPQVMQSYIGMCETRRLLTGDDRNGMAWACAVQDNRPLRGLDTHQHEPFDPSGASFLSRQISIYHTYSDLQKPPPPAPPDTTYLATYDFEGAGGTADTQGWTTTSLSNMDNLAALHNGITVLQDSKCEPGVNLTWLWGFFEEPFIAPYDCRLPLPFPSQGTIPLGWEDEIGPCVRNEIWSPKIAWSGVGTSVVLEFDVYRENPLEYLVFYTWRVRSWVNDSPGPWRDRGVLYYGNDREWTRQRHEVGDLIDPAATHVQIALGVWDMACVWCSILGTSCSCHSHAPLFDNVQLMRVNTDGPRWDVRPVDLFQDSFAEDGTVTGTVRADAAIDVASRLSGDIRPGDSVCVGVGDPVSGLAGDTATGTGPAVYCYVSVWPPGQAGKSGPGIEAPETRGAVGKRFPLVDSLLHDDQLWYCFRMDTCFLEFEDTTGVTISFPIPDRYCFDLKDNVFTPCDTVCFIFSAENTTGTGTYWSEFTGVT